MSWQRVLAPAAADDLEDAVAFYEMQNRGLVAHFYERSTTDSRAS